MLQGDKMAYDKRGGVLYPQLPKIDMGRSVISGVGSRTFGIRHFQAFIMFLCVAVSFLMRINVNVAIVLMTDSNPGSGQTVFDWSMVQQSTIMGSFHVGYFVMNLSAAVLVTMFENKTLLLFSIAVSSLVTLATPFLTIAGGFYALLTTRICLGLLQGFIMAITMGQLSRWILPEERSRCGSLILGGINFGSMISFAFSGWFGANFGWPSIFYFSGCAGVVCSVLWFVVGADGPSSSWLVSKEERIHIEKHLVLTSEVSKERKIPWRGMFTNKACWALLLTSMAHNWGNWTLLNEMPSYFHAVLHLDSTKMGLISALPHACLWLFSFISSYISDYVIKKGILSVGVCRKLCNTIGHCGCAVALLLLSYTQDVMTVLIIYPLSGLLLGFIYNGFGINHLDIVPSYAGFFMGITNGLATITSFAGTEFAGIIVTEPENKNQWQIVFGVSAAVFFLADLIFVIFGSGEVQPIENLDEKPRRDSISVPT